MIQIRLQKGFGPLMCCIYLCQSNNSPFPILTWAQWAVRNSTHSQIFFISSCFKIYLRTLQSTYVTFFREKRNKNKKYLYFDFHRTGNKILQQFNKISSKYGILFLKLCWPTVRKNCSSDREKLLKFKAEGIN